MVLRHVDDERIARVLGQKISAHRRFCRVGGAFDIADLVDAQRLGKDAVGDSVATEGFERAGEDGAGLGIAGESGIFLEQLERETVEMEPQRGGEPDRTRADHEYGLHGLTSAGPSSRMR